MNALDIIKQQLKKEIKENRNPNPTLAKKRNRRLKKINSFQSLISELINKDVAYHLTNIYVLKQHNYKAIIGDLYIEMTKKGYDYVILTKDKDLNKKVFNLKAVRSVYRQN